jgi:hypothetical protein
VRHCGDVRPRVGDRVVDGVEVFMQAEPLDLPGGPR